jgi:hypothetical protein
MSLLDRTLKDSGLLARIAQYLNPQPAHLFASEHRETDIDKKGSRGCERFTNRERYVPW